MSTETTTTTTTETQTKFVKVEREQFDKVLRAGTPEFIAMLPKLTAEELQRGERWANDLRIQKAADTYLVFPVRQEKQLAAGRLYLQALSKFRSAVRTELAARAATTMFAAPAAEAVAA